MKIQPAERTRGVKEYYFSRKQKDLDAWGSGKDVEIEETLFFYPLVAVLNRLALEIYNLQNK